MESYILNVATQIIIQAIAAYGLNVIVGNAGQISLGHAAFVGIGAYSAAMLTTAAGFASGSRCRSRCSSSRPSGCSADCQACA
ncbi:MAG: ABC transporter permease subunit [Cloacibacillus evryensis]